MLILLIYLLLYINESQVSCTLIVMFYILTDLVYIYCAFTALYCVHVLSFVPFFDIVHIVPQFIPFLTH